MSTTTDPRPHGTPASLQDSQDAVGRLNPGAWLLVMNREIVVRALNKAFLVGLVVSLVLIGGVLAFVAWQSERTDSYTVAVVGDDATAVAVAQTARERGLASAEAAEASEDGDDGDEAAAGAAGFGAVAVPQADITVLEVADDAAARTALEDGTADAWLHRAGAGDPGAGWTLAGWSEPSGTLTTLLGAGVTERVLADNAARAGTSVAELTAGSTLTTERLDGHAVDRTFVFMAGFAFAFLFLMGAIGSGAMVAGSVVEEKQSRLVEIMAPAVSLRHLLAGKILGSSVIALAQNVLFAGVGLVGLSFTPLAQTLPAMSVSLGWFVAFFTVGFVAVASLYAVAGALASRTEDLQSTSTPMTMLVMAVYFLTFSASGTFEKVLSFVPLTSVVSMPVRVLAGEAAWWEALVSLGILAAFTAVAVLVCERAYRGALMQTGGRVTWRKALTAEA
ncbi:ABC transporter permease [Xylanimonas oleitrophica]|uniref:ABC transporter permease n=1 Tax=Xylanimonas oleitrophica TaxID=2607479 RepID=A0A2W5YFP8_9MICO|nr:ABC transporter permease [Xylanimonas oleitrophica]PZR53401.1 ABC transporter permease [Xylanimonas oleitrophica]